MRVERLGQRAVLLRDLPSEAYVLARHLNDFPDLFDPGLRFQEAVASYETLGLYFDSFIVDFSSVIASLQVLNLDERIVGRKHVLPVCYEMGEDLVSAAHKLEIGVDQVIQHHLGSPFRCYAVGFSPGFAYLGYLPEEIANLPRLDSPRVQVQPGSVGITGRQTAVYPSATPGGWNLIGRCPLTLVDVEDVYFPIEAGDSVQFRRIDEREFGRLLGERL